MFYDTSWVEAPAASRNGHRVTVVLTPAESKRLIGRGVASLPEVRQARERGRLIITRGTTNAYVVEELLDRPVPKDRFAAGIICRGILGTVPRGERLPVIALKEGRPAEMSADALLQEFERDDVFIKGANALDPAGNAGVLVAGVTGGTIGNALASVSARGAHLIVPVGLEKLVPSVIEASRHLGVLCQRHTTGLPVGLIPLVTASVVTEVQALRMLAGVTAYHVASGGVGGSEGSVVLALEGSEEAQERAWDLLRAIKGEPATPSPATVSTEL